LLESGIYRDDALSRYSSSPRSCSSPSAKPLLSSVWPETFVVVTLVALRDLIVDLLPGR
jgi:hypothetical protein